MKIHIFLLLVAHLVMLGGCVQPIEEGKLRQLKPHRMQAIEQITDTCLSSVLDLRKDEESLLLSRWNMRPDYRNIITQRDATVIQESTEIPCGYDVEIMIEFTVRFHKDTADPIVVKSNSRH